MKFQSIPLPPREAPSEGAQPYSAIVYYDNPHVVARNSRGFLIDSGIAYEDDEKVIQSAIDSLSEGLVLVRGVDPTTVSVTEKDKVKVAFYYQGIPRYTSVHTENISIADDLGIPSYSSDGDAPNSCLFFNTSLNQYRFKDSTGNIRYSHSASDHESGGALEMLLDNMAGSLGLGQISTTARQGINTALIPTTTIADGNFISFRVYVPSGKTLKMWSAGVQNTANNAPAGVTFQVYDETNAVDIIAATNSKRSEGTPLGSKAGAIDVGFRLNNNSGASDDITGFFTFTIE